MQNIEIVISPEYIQTTIEFLISNNYPFFLNANFVTTNTKKDETYNNSNEHVEATPEDSKKYIKNDIAVIYKKYIIDYLEKTPKKLDEIAKECDLSVQSLKNKFLKEYGKTYYQTYLEKKMEHAAGLLKRGQTATYISKQFGYSHPIKFNKMFQKHFGITPKKFQMMHRTKHTY